jgi:hypothetical protein
MCVVCRKIKTEGLFPEDLRDMLDEVSSKISEDHYEEAEELLMEYESNFSYMAETEEYFKRNLLEEEYGDELDGYQITDGYDDYSYED